MNDVELSRLEQRLARLSPAAPPAELRKRVARTVTWALRRQSIERLTFAGLAAAGLVLGANLSWIASRSATFVKPPAASDADIAGQIRDLLPDLSEAEVRRQAVVLRCAAGLPDGNAARRAARLGVIY
jgi:hypothetical protein